MAYAAYGVAPIKCGKRKCTWTGLETDRKQVPHPKFADAMVTVCPLCGCDSYEFIKVKEGKK